MSILLSPSTLPSALTSGTQGMAAASTRLAQSAGNIARAAYTANSVDNKATGQQPGSANPVSAPELNRELLEMKRDQLLFDASARVVKTSDNMIGSLLNIRV